MEILKSYKGNLAETTVVRMLIIKQKKKKRKSKSQEVARRWKQWYCKIEIKYNFS